jgi:hypothetical protein
VRLKEQQLWDTMRNNAPSCIKLMRVENLVMAGMPDVHAVAAGIENLHGFCGWVELKSVTTPKRAGTRLMGGEGLNKDQINWHLIYTKFGGRSWVLCRDSGKRLYLVPGHLARDMNEYTADQMRAASVAASWEGIFNTLRGLT